MTRTRQLKACSASLRLHALAPGVGGAEGKKYGAGGQVLCRSLNFREQLTAEQPLRIHPSLHAYTHEHLCLHYHGSNSINICGRTVHFVHHTHRIAPSHHNIFIVLDMSAPGRSTPGPRGNTQGQNVGTGSNSFSSRSAGPSQGDASSQPRRSQRWPIRHDCIFNSS